MVFWFAYSFDWDDRVGFLIAVSSTFSESSGREVSHGGTLVMCFNIKISVFGSFL